MTEACKGLTQVESPLRRLRRSVGVSQRRFALRCGISRGRLRRLEGEAFDEATYGELRRMANALGLDLNRLVEINPSLQSGFYLSRGETISFQVDGRSVGYRIISSVPPQPNLFVGKLLVLPKASLSSIQTPHAEIIFLQMILGSLAVTFKGESHEVREGRSLLFQGDQPYRIENQLVRESVGLLVTHPAFTQGQGVEKVERSG